MLKIENYIGGELSAPASGEYLDNFNPATGEVYSLIPDSDERDVEKAVEAAKKAFPDLVEDVGRIAPRLFNKNFKSD